MNYEYNLLKAKTFYHEKMYEDLTDKLMKVNDPIERKRIIARRAQHRHLYVKYHALAENCRNTMESKGNIEL